MDKNLSNCGYNNYKVFVADNGSNENEILNYIEKFNYVKRYSTNQGISKAFNHLIKKAYDKNFDSFVLLGNDIAMPDNWLKCWIDHHLHYKEESGIIGMQCSIPVIKLEEYKGKVISKIEIGDRVFGCWYLPRLLIDKVGYLFEYPGTYGIEDSDYNERVTRSGFTSFYVDSTKWKTDHLDMDIGENTEYRQMKDRSLNINQMSFGFRLSEYYSQNKRLYHNPFE